MKTLPVDKPCKTHNPPANAGWQGLTGSSNSQPLRGKPDPFFIGEGDTRRCPQCSGFGTRGHGIGHFGDCNGDAGEAWKPARSLCPTCYGRGVMPAL